MAMVILRFIEAQLQVLRQAERLPYNFTGGWGRQRFGLQSGGRNGRRYDALEATGRGCGLDFWAKTT
jgi:hypothetical protein